MWLGNRRPRSEIEYREVAGVPELSIHELSQGGRQWSCCKEGTHVVPDCVPVMTRRIRGKCPKRHLAEDPEHVARPQLWHLMHWFGFWRGDLRRVAPPCELRQLLRSLDRGFTTDCVRYGVTISRRIRPAEFGKLWSDPEQNRAYQQLDRYLEILESRSRPTSVREVVASDELMHLCLSFMGPQTAGAACCTSHRFNMLTESEEMWHGFLLAHWPAAQALCKGRSSKACYSYRIQLTRDAAGRCYERDHVGLFSEDRSEQWMVKEAARYQLMVEIFVGQKVLLADTLDLSYDIQKEDICALVPASCFPPTAFDELEEELRMTLTLIRRADGKCLVVGDRMDISTTLNTGEVCLGFGSSPINRKLDEVLYVLSKHPICNLVLRNRSEHWFLHEVAFVPVIREEDRFLVGISRICIGLHGVCSPEAGGRKFPGIVFATWDELAIWT